MKLDWEKATYSDVIREHSCRVIAFVTPLLASSFIPACLKGAVIIPVYKGRRKDPWNLEVTAE